MTNHFISNFSLTGSPHVIIAFKRINREGNEHWLNKMAVNLTKRSDDEFPCGQLAHVELMFENRGKWFRCSINKKTGTYDAKGKITWKAGTVHYKQVSETSMADYDYFEYKIDREKQRQIHNFCMSQMENTFNFWGYVLNFFIPFGRIGTRKYSNRLERKKAKWFCSELIVVALQSAGHSSFSELEARSISPNELYRMCSRIDIPFICSPVIDIQI
jgi:hypothetical protein